MATQSLYRRYRPRRFSELKGQDHVVRALRTSVAEGREGQAYLFSGPRGTGKTTSARILAKVLNCVNPQDGEPCCECASCLAVEQGTSYDVHELDAASNNGVDAMRDLIEKASLGTPGRHKVYILDEVHMLSKGAEAALLKTLEEPPPHVVFVLATTDPQKMSDTIRSRTQHLQFHLLPTDTLHEHVQWVAADAGLEITPDAIEQVLAQGGGSARDTLSALELVANAGGDATEVMAVDEFVEAMIEHEPGRALTMVAAAVSRGRDPRTVTEELIAFLRNGFLSIMAPELVQLPSSRIAALTEQSRRLGPAGLVRGIEQLGAALTEMRHAPDPRVLLDVAIVRLTSEEAAGDLAALTDRVARLERRLADGVPSGAAAPPTTAVAAGAAAAAAADPAPEDPATGRKAIGGRARRGGDSPTPTDAAAESPGAPAGAEPGGGSDRERGPDQADAIARGGAAPDVASPADESPASGESAAGPDGGAVPPSRSASDPEPTPEPAPAPAGGAPTAAQWETARSGLRGMARAVFAPAEFVGAAPGRLTLGLPNATHRQKCEQHRATVEEALAGVVGGPVEIELVEGGGDGPGGGPGGSSGGGSGGSGGGSFSPAGEPEADSRGGGPTRGDAGGEARSRAGSPSAMAAAVAAIPDEVEARDPDVTPHLRAVPRDEPTVSGRAIAEAARSGGPRPSDLDEPDRGPVSVAELPDDDEIDLDDLVDAPPETVRTPMDRLAEAFPGSELVDDVL